MDRIETETVIMLASAIEFLQDASAETQCGLTDDHIQNAIVEAAHAIRQLTWHRVAFVGGNDADRDYGDEQSA